MFSSRNHDEMSIFRMRNCMVILSDFKKISRFEFFNNKLQNVFMPFLRHEKYLKFYLDNKLNLLLLKYVD